MSKPTERAAVLSLLIVFLCGAVAGAIGMSIAKNSAMHGAKPVASGLSMSVTEWKKELNLRDDQTHELTSILDDFSRYYDNVLSDGNSRILQILDPDQKKRFEQMLREHRK